MTYRLQPGTPLGEEIKRIGAGQIGIVLTRLSARASEGTAVHDARRAIKRLRALAAFIRPVIGKAVHKDLQDRLKAIAQPLSGLRDVQAMLATVASLERHDRATGCGPVAAALRDVLEARGRDAGEHVDRNAARAARKMARQVRDIIIGLPLEGHGFGLLTRGLEDNYRKARRAFADAYDTGTGHAFHEWRKLTQRHWRHLQLITRASPKRMRPLIRLARDLSNLLGDDHDLEVLRDFVKAEEMDLGSREEVKAYLALCRERQRALRSEARQIGKRLYALKPGAFADCVRQRWKRAEAQAAGRAA
jgi:CHAD domain-containing protein